MIKVGLTGSIGMGKSTVAAMFADEGVPVFDADAAVHRLQGPGGRLLDAIERDFPGTVRAGGVDRIALGEAVFGNAWLLAKLEAIVHPAVAEERADFLAANASAALVLFDVPLLLEKGGDRGLDAIVVVSAPAAIQQERVMARAGMTADKFARIVSYQMPDAEKRARADFVIDTGTSLEVTRERVREVVACLLARLS